VELWRYDKQRKEQTLFEGFVVERACQEFVLCVIYAATQEVAGQACLFLLVTVFAKAFFTLVGGHLVAFSFLSAGHSREVLCIVRQ
jgi:hypothetical protein